MADIRRVRRVRDPENNESIVTNVIVDGNYPDEYASMLVDILESLSSVTEIIYTGRDFDNGYIYYTFIYDVDPYTTEHININLYLGC